MLHLPKKTYSRKNKSRTHRNERKTGAQVERLDLDVNETLPDDIWKDSFDKLKELESVPTPKSRNSHRVFPPKNSVGYSESIYSFVSTPKIASQQLRECPLPYSPIGSRRYFLSNNYYDSRGNPQLIFEYSSEKSQAVLQDFGGDASHKSNQSKSENLLRNQEMNVQNTALKRNKLRDNTNVISSITRSRETRKRKTKSRITLTGKENIDILTKDGKASEVQYNVENENISLISENHKKELNCSLILSNSVTKEPAEISQALVSSVRFQKSNQRRGKKRHNSKTSSFSRLSKPSTTKAAEIATKRCKQAELPEDLVNTSKSVDEKLNQNEIISAHSETSKREYPKRCSKAKTDPVESYFELSTKKASYSKRLDANSFDAEIQKISDDCSVIPPSQKTPLKSRKFRKTEVTRTKKTCKKRQKSRKTDRYLPLPFVEVIAGKKSEQSIIATGEVHLNTVLDKLRKSMNEETTEVKQITQTETGNLKEATANICHLTGNDEGAKISPPKITPLENIEKDKTDNSKSPKSTRSSSNSSNASLILQTEKQDDLPERLSKVTRRTRNRLKKSVNEETTEVKRRTQTETEYLKEATAEIFQLTSKDESPAISPSNMVHHENIDKSKNDKTRQNKSQKATPSSNVPLLMLTEIQEDLSERLSYVTRRTRDRQSNRQRRNDPIIAEEVVDIQDESSCLNTEELYKTPLPSSEPETNSINHQMEGNKVRWEASPSFIEKSSYSPANKSLDNSTDMKEFISAVNQTTSLAVMNMRRGKAQRADSPNPKQSIILQPGKWRKSLNMWRRLNATQDKINNRQSVLVSAQNRPLSSHSFMRTFCNDTFNKSSSRPTDHRSSTKLCNSSYSFGRRAIVNYNKSAHIFKEIEDIFDIKDTIAEDRSDTDIICNESALLLEPTDDESPNQSTFSHLTSVCKQNVCTPIRRTQTVCYKDFCSPGDTEYSNETSNERTQRYQHQLSVPLPLCRQPSISRRRRTSIVGLPAPGIGGSLCENDLFTEFVRLSTYEVSLRAQLDARDIILRRCGQSEPLNFIDEYSERALHQCRKIGEGVYGEVFMNKNFSGETVVLKIIPIEGSIEINGEPQKKFDEILSEIVIAMELSCLRNDKEYATSGFVEVKKVRCVTGRYPDHLIDLWELYRENHGTENDHPEIFPEDQLYVVFELANGGQDLEAFTFQNALQSYSAFVQVALTLAAAERKFQFEHRDLHWGNILLATTEEKELSFRIAGKEIKIPTHGVKATIIDYTLSRMMFDGCCLYNNLSNDNDLFCATGDYQFDIYRFMKKHLEDQWGRFEPYTNVLWLHYAIDKMISGARYRYSKSKKHRAAIQDMMQLRDEMLDFKSASDYIECLN